ncbi:glycosyltransferase [Winogradskyella sp.]|uniref:glycosyltransferase n=1 Tax=Winogradskyella sp. TaxID=1883156 RepID=UPI003BA86724
MNILIVNTYDKGGAANACIRLHNALLNHGYSSKLLVLHRSDDQVNDNIFKFKTAPSGLNSILKRIINKFDFKKKKKKEKERLFRSNRSVHLEYFSFPYSEYDITQSELYKEADVINLHWVAQFLDYDSFFKKNKKPVVWTLHDMSPFLGGEHYNEIYDGIDDGGMPKSRVHNNLELKVFDEIIEKKLNIFRQVNNLMLISPSNWLKRVAENSQVFNKFPCYHVPNTIESESFKILNKKASQKDYDITHDGIKLLFVSQSLNNSRKGIKILVKAFESLENDQISLYAVGDSNNVDFDALGINSLGIIKEEEEMNKIYNAVDVFILPSLMDNLPNTAIESCLSGTPVIGFDVGGIPEIIEDGYNGILIKKHDAEGLKDGIKKFLEEGVKWSAEEIRNDAIAKYNSKLIVNKYIDVYNEAIKDSC